MFHFKILCFGLTTFQVFIRVFTLASTWAHAQGIRLDLVGPGKIPEEVTLGHRPAASILSHPRCCDKLGEIESGPQSKDFISGYNYRHSTGESFSIRSENREVQERDCVLCLRKHNQQSSGK